MREVNCKSLGYACNWKHIAHTEELLADITAVHLRDVHGVKAVTQDLVGRIKKAFTFPTKEEEAELADADLDLKVYNCDMDPKCGWRYIAMTEELIVDGAAVHAREAHGIREFSPEMMARVKQSAHEWDWDRGKQRKTA
jgi:predicted small metal-binding protein